MPVYNVSGSAINTIFAEDGTQLASAYDISGDSVFPDVTPKSWNMSDNYKGQVLSVLSYISNYKKQNESSYAVAQFNDVHQLYSGNEPNFIDYNNGYSIIDAILYVGDMVNNASSEYYAKAVDYMSGAEKSKRLVIMGNHEYGSYSASVGNPETIYKAVINADCTFKDQNLLIYYHDDAANNVRFIALDYFYITKTSSNSGHLLDMDQLNWLAGVLENSGNKDIIVAAHSMLNPFLGLESGETLSSSETVQNHEALENLIVAYKNRSTYTVTVDNVSYSHDFSQCTGKFIMYTSGHYHALGYGDFGFNMFTCPTLQTPYGGSHIGFVFYLINPAQNSIKVFQCSSALSDYISFDYSY